MPEQTITTLVVDSDESAVFKLTQLVHGYCPEIEIVSVCSSFKQAVNAISEYHPQLVITETELPDGNGFDLVQNQQERNFKVVFITANCENAIKAFRFSASDYLLKPVKKEELLEAVKKVKTELSEPDSYEGLKNYLVQLNGNNEPLKTLVVHNSKGFTVLKTDEIIYLEADGYCTNFYLLGKVKISSSRNLKYYIDLLPDAVFMRVHHSFIVNLNHVTGYNCQEEILLTGNLSCSLSAAHKTRFMGYFKHKK
jgi:two-component system, LytTR family, response regulator